MGDDAAVSAPRHAARRGSLLGLALGLVAVLAGSNATGDVGVAHTIEQILEDVTAIVVARPVGEPRYAFVIVGSDPRPDLDLVNYTRDVAISRTVFGVETGVLAVGTVGWNPRSPRPPQTEVEIDGVSLPLIGPLPDGEALFFLKPFADGVTYGLVGEDRGRVPLHQDPGSGAWRTAPDALVPELADKPLDELIEWLRTQLRKRRSE